MKAESHSPYVAELYLRSRFEVTDPAAVKDLKVSATYHGGIIVYVNGKEITRANVKSGAAVAEVYPARAFVTETDQLIPGRGADKEATGLRDRRITDVEVPASALKQEKRVNVLAIEAIRAPV